jgi:hypothetical protein
VQAAETVGIKDALDFRIDHKGQDKS